MGKRINLYDYFVAASKHSAQVRDTWERRGIHVPLLMAANISLSCKVGYSSCPPAFTSGERYVSSRDLLTDAEWDHTFQEAEQLGVRFVFLMGGDPLRCKDIFKKIKHYDKMVFSILTNGTLLDEEYLKLFQAYPHLSPILSLEGCLGMSTSPYSKGTYLYEGFMAAIDRLQQRNIPYGTYMVINSQNYCRLVNLGFLNELYRHGCSTVIYMEVEKQELTDSERCFIEEQFMIQQDSFPDMKLLFRPKEDAVSEHSMAYGERFFQVTPDGIVEPRRNTHVAENTLKYRSLLDILSSDIYA